MRYVPTRVEDWDLQDPAELDLDGVRATREDIEERVRALIDDRLPELLSDRNAHQLRLVRLLPQLVDEFEGVRSPEEIRACADAILRQYDEAPVRSFVISLAHRRTRDCPRSEVCEPLAPL